MFGTLQAFSVIANSPLRIDLSCVLDHVVSELTTFLRKVMIYLHGLLLPLFCFFLPLNNLSLGSKLQDKA